MSMLTNFHVVKCKSFIIFVFSFVVYSQYFVLFAQKQKIIYANGYQFDSTRTGYYKIYHPNPDKRKYIIMEGKYIRGTKVGVWKIYSHKTGLLVGKERYSNKNSIIVNNLKKYPIYVAMNDTFEQMKVAYQFHLDTTTVKDIQLVTICDDSTQKLFNKYRDKMTQYYPCNVPIGWAKYYGDKEDDNKGKLIKKELQLKNNEVKTYIPYRLRKKTKCKMQDPPRPRSSGSLN